MNTEIDMAGRNAKGWRSVIGCSLAIFWSGALIFGYPGVMSSYWSTTLNASPGLVMTFVLIALGIGTFLCGKWHMKVGTRNSYFIGTAVQLVGMLFVTYAKNIYMVWVWAFMGAAGISMVSLSKTYSVYLGIGGVMALTAFNLTNGLSRIVAGALSDAFGRQKLGMLAFVLGGIGYICLCFTTTVVPFCIFAAFVGFAFGTLFAISGPLATDLFGLEYFGMNFGLIFTAYGFVGGIVGPMLASAVLGWTGSYTVVFIYLAVFCFLAGAFVLGAKPEKTRN